VILLPELKGAKMKARKVRDRHEASRLLCELELSTQPLVAFCRRRGIDGRSLHCWRLNLRQEPRRPATPLHLVELAMAPARTALYRVIIDGIEVEVDDDFRDDTLARLLAVVAAC